MLILRTVKKTWSSNKVVFWTRLLEQKKLPNLLYIYNLKHNYLGPNSFQFSCLQTVSSFHSVASVQGLSFFSSQTRVFILKRYDNQQL